jgi:FAD/FMN-containing dehydrogenase
MTLADFNREMERAGQWLPLDPPGGAGATLGGIVATGTAGAQALGYGAPRSYVLGMKVALAGGRVIRVGGRVVKNVAGYDLCKLFTASHGTLGVILELTFKLRPRPRREATLVARSKDLAQLIEASRALAGSQLLPVAVELLSPRMANVIGLSEEGAECFMLARFAGTEGTVEYQLARAGEIVEGRAAVASVEDDASLWSRLSEATRLFDTGVAWRACVPPTELGAMLARLRDSEDAERRDAWHAGACDGRLRVFESNESSREHERDARAFLNGMREAARGAGGSLVIERATADFRQSFDSWGLSDSAAFLMRRVKEQLDPSDTFSPGRFNLKERSTR